MTTEAPLLPQLHQADQTLKRHSLRHWQNYVDVVLDTTY